MSQAELEAQYFKDSLILLKKDLAIRVEGVSDVAFWAKAFEIALPHLKTEVFYQGIHFSAKNKSTALLVADFADRELVVCVDSDYDYLLENATYQILQKPFIFQTYVYSVENYWSIAEGLNEVIAKGTNTEGGTFDFEQYFKDYSEIIFDFFTYTFFLYSHGEDDSPIDTAEFLTFTQITKPFDELNELKKRIQEKLAKGNDHFNSWHHCAFNRRFIEPKMTRENVYLFLHGHTLFERLTMKLVKHIGDPLTKEVFESLKKVGDSNTLAKYHNYLKNNTFKSLLEENKAMLSNSFYLKIIEDIKTSFS